MDDGPGRVLHLIDTPGFDDTHRSSADILKEIAWILGALYRENISLLGFVYLHRITDPRIGGSGLRSLRMFEKLCGAQCFPNVTLVTTMWEALGEGGIKIGELRESILKETDEFWGNMYRAGATVLRHNGRANSAFDILWNVRSKRTSVVADIQLEMIDGHKQLYETSVGEYLLKECLDVRSRLEKEREELEDSMEEAVRDKDGVLITALREQQEKLEMLTQQSHSDQDYLNITFEGLDEERAERSASLFQERKRREDEKKELERRIEKLQDDLDEQEAKHNQAVFRMRTDKRRDQQNLAEERARHEAEKRCLTELLKEQLALTESKESEIQKLKHTESQWSKFRRSILPTSSFLSRSHTQPLPFGQQSQIHHTVRPSEQYRNITTPHPVTGYNTVLVAPSFASPVISGPQRRYPDPPIAPIVRRRTEPPRIEKK
jgi:hypothetical protein